VAHCLVVGPSVNDLDCLGSLALAQVLYPEATIAKSGRLHPGAANLYTLFRDHLSLGRVQDLKGLQVEKMIVLDTRSLGKIQEYLPVLPSLPPSFEVWDHHKQETCDIPGALIHEKPYGSNTTILALELRNRGMSVTQPIATIALTGIYADTGGG